MSNLANIPECHNPHKNIYFQFCKSINAVECSDKLLYVIKAFKRDYGLTGNNLNSNNKKLWVAYYKKYG